MQCWQQRKTFAIDKSEKFETSCSCFHYQLHCNVDIAIMSDAFRLSDSIIIFHFSRTKFFQNNCCSSNLLPQIFCYVFDDNPWSRNPYFN